jgi:hypothetical protein
MRLKLYLSLIVGLMIAVSACKHNPYIVEIDPNDSTDNPIDTTNNPIDTTENPVDTTTVACDPDSAYFQNDVLPILVSNCAKSGCHDPITQEKDFDFSSYNGFMGDDDAVRPGNLNNSDMWEVINEDDEDKIMPPPPNAPLTTAQKNIIRTWILQGAKNNVCNNNPVTCDTTNVTFSGTVMPILQNKCQGCHSGTAPSGGVNLTFHAGVAVVANNGKLVGVINHAPGFPAMPQGGQKLPSCEIAKITAWVNSGAPNN